MTGNLEITCPEPGIYPGVSFETYAKWPAINHSKLCRIDKSPLHAITPVDIGQKKAIRFGQLVHSGQLEFDSVLKRYAVIPDYHLMPENVTGKGVASDSKATTFYKERSSWFYSEAAKSGKVVVSMDEFKQMDDTLLAILKCKAATDCLHGGDAELSIVWKDENTGLLCKARIDYKRPDRLTDLKTSRDSKPSPLPESFEWSLWSFSYYSQAAWYQDGWRQLTGEKLPFWFVVVTNDGPPIQCIAAPVGEMSLIIGRKKNADRMEKWLACVDADKWPGYSSPVMFELPDKYMDWTPDEADMQDVEEIE